MNLVTKYRGLKSAVATAILAASTSVAMAGAFDNPGNIQGPTIGRISRNVSSSIFDVAAGFEAFLYLLGVVFLVLFILAAWKYKKSDGRDGNMGLVCAYLVLSVCSFSAPTVMGSMGVTLFGTGARTSVTAPTSVNFN